MTYFHIEDGLPYAGPKAYPWAYEVNDNAEFGWGYSGFELLLENGWTVHVMWAISEDWPEFKPLGEVAAVDCSARYLVDSCTWHNGEDGEWPHLPFSDWVIPRVYGTSYHDIDIAVALASSMPSPPFGEPEGARRNRLDRERRRSLNS